MNGVHEKDTYKSDPRRGQNVCLEFSVVVKKARIRYLDLLAVALAASFEVDRDLFVYSAMKVYNSSSRPVTPFWISINDTVVIVCNKNNTDRQQIYRYMCTGTCMTILLHKRI